MSSYYREQGYGSRKQFLRHIKFVWLLLVVGLLAAGGFFAYDAFRQTQQSNQPSAESKTESSLIVADTQVITTPYFQFQTSKKWKTIANESRANHFVYREYNGSLVEQELVVDINSGATQALANVLVTRVLPVTVSGTGKLASSGISPTCSDIIKPAKSNYALMAKYKNVTFACNPQTTNYYVVVGLVGGTDAMKLPRPDGSMATYNISYKNITAQPGVGDLDNIIDTFETR